MRPLIFVLYHLCIACVNGLRDGNLKTSEFSQIVVIPDTHGDVVALLRSLLLAIQVADEPAVVTASSFMDLFRLAIDNDTYPATPLSTATDIALVQLRPGRSRTVQPRLRSNDIGNSADNWLARDCAVWQPRDYDFP